MNQSCCVEDCTLSSVSFFAPVLAGAPERRVPCLLRNKLIYIKTLCISNKYHESEHPLPSVSSRLRCLWVSVIKMFNRVWLKFKPLQSFLIYISLQNWTVTWCLLNGKQFSYYHSETREMETLDLRKLVQLGEGIFSLNCDNVGKSIFAKW